MRKVNTDVVILIAAMIICTSVVILEKPIGSTMADIVGIIVFVLTGIMAGISAVSLLISKHKNHDR